VTRALALTALLFFPLPGAGGGEGQGEGALHRAAAALADEDVPAAREILEPLLASRPRDAAVQSLAGVLRFHEQRYPEAVELLEKAGGATLGRIEYLPLARAAREITRDHVLVRGAHFAVSHPPGKEEVLVPYLLEALEAQRAALLEDLGRVPEEPVTVEVVETPRALARLSTLSEREIRTSGTIALCKFNKLMVVSPKAMLHGYDWLDTAAHEYTHHAVTARTRNNAPIWLQEGLAKWEETRWRGRPGEALSAFSAALLRDAARRDRLIGFEEMHPSMAKLPSQEAAALAFAEVMVAVEYLAEKGGGALLRDVLDRVAGGGTAEQAVAGALGAPFSDFLADWKRYLAARPVPEGGERELRRLRFQDDPDRAHGEWGDLPDGKAREYARLGEIMRERGLWTAARVEYAKAMRRAGPGHPVLAGKFALAAMQSGREAEAESALRDAVRGHPHAASLQTSLGRLRVRRGDWAGAREAFLVANRIDPFDPEIHVGLAAAAEGMGDGEAASRERRFAQILSGSGARPH
jgi:tetratricopeptide (TPR) repeat protein